MTICFRKPLLIPLVILAAFLYFSASTNRVMAVTCGSVPISGSYTVSSSCTFSNSGTDGVDNGNLTIATGQTLTITAGQTIVWNPAKTITVTGNIAVSSTGKLQQNYLWMTDADVDGYPASTTLTAASSAPTNGRRKYLMTSITAVDVNDNNAAVYQNLTGYADADGDTYTTGGATPVQSGATLPSGWRSAASGSDCNDADATKWQNLTGYNDADGDAYTSGSTLVCSGASLPAYNITTSPYRAAATATDCNDANASLYQNLTGYTDADVDGVRLNSINQNPCSGASLPLGYTANVNGPDCNDANGAVWRNRYRDVDADAFGAGAVVCVGNDAGYVDNATDCNDGNATIWQYLTGYSDADNDTYTTGAAQSICSGASLPSGYRAAASGADCNDADATKWQNLTGYTDADADGYGGASASVCSGASLPAPYVATGGDCYDSNANAHPGQLASFTTNRGDGSFDYNCDGTIQSDTPYRNLTASGWNCIDAYGVCGGSNGFGYNVPISASDCGVFNWYCGINTTLVSCSPPGGGCGPPVYNGGYCGWLTLGCR